jgi:hypothetical protein
MTPRPNPFRAFARKMLAAAGRPPSFDSLPELHSFVDVALGGERHRHSISVDAIGPDGLTTRPIDGLQTGMSADFLYKNISGRFRFATVCDSVDERHAHFRPPTTVKTIVLFGSKRRAVRLDAVLPVDWRYAPDGAGFGDYLKGSLSDLSKSGAWLIVGRELKTGTQVELRFSLKASMAPLVIISDVVRTAKIESSGKNSAGIRFRDVDSASEGAINDFILERQMQRRDRGLV